MNQATQEFIRTHEKDNIFAISLAARSSDEIDYQLAIRQINGRQKIKLKVPTFYNCPHILYPVQLSLEQSSSESTALYKAAHCKGETFVDLTGGWRRPPPGAPHIPRVRRNVGGGRQNRRRGRWLGRE